MQESRGMIDLGEAAKVLEGGDARGKEQEESLPLN